MNIVEYTYFIETWALTRTLFTYGSRSMSRVKQHKCESLSIDLPMLTLLHLADYLDISSPARVHESGHSVRTA